MPMNDTSTNKFSVAGKTIIVTGATRGIGNAYPCSRLRKWKTAAFSQYQRVIPGYGKVAGGMGYSMRTDRYRFTEWQVPGTDSREYEIYDHQIDPQENVNIANRNSHQEIVQKLRKRLKGWQVFSTLSLQFRKEKSSQ